MRPEAKRRRRKWVKFADSRREKFIASKGSSICSKHFKPDDFTIRFKLLLGHERPMFPRLKRDKIRLLPFAFRHIFKPIRHLLWAHHLDRLFRLPHTRLLLLSQGFLPIDRCLFKHVLKVLIIAIKRIRRVLRYFTICITCKTYNLGHK